MSQSPENSGSDFSLGRRLLEQATQNFAEGLVKSGNLHPGVIVRLEVLNPDEARKYTHQGSGITYHGKDGIARKGDKLANFTDTEGDVFERLMKERNRVVRKGALLEEVWGYTYAGDERLKATINSLRKKLGPLGVDPTSFIKTVHGKGYLIDDAVDDKNAVAITRNDQVSLPEERSDFIHEIFEFNKDRHRLKIDEHFVGLTKLENGILDLLCTNVNRIVTKARLVLMLSEESVEANLRTHISHLRVKIKNNRDISDPIIMGIRGVGYMLVDFSKMNEQEKAAILRNSKKGGTNLRMY